MSEFDPIQKLIRLKRHEQPPVDFVDDFVRTFQQRQRLELLQKSVRVSLFERATNFFDDLMTPKWGWAFATVLAFMGASYMMKPAGKMQVADNSSAANKASVAEIRQDTDERFLISRHYNGGLADEPHGSMAPVGLRVVSEDVVLLPR